MQSSIMLKCYLNSAEWLLWSGAATAGFVWSDGTPVDFESWSGPGLLADGLDCVDIYAATATWNKRSCVETRNWICKIHKGS